MSGTKIDWRECDHQNSKRKMAPSSTMFGRRFEIDECLTCGAIRVTVREIRGSDRYFWRFPWRHHLSVHDVPAEETPNAFVEGVSA